MELVQHKPFTLVTQMQAYFCDLQRLWQRGINDNTNRLLRQYLSHDGDSLTIRAAGDADSMRSHAVGQAQNIIPKPLTLDYLPFKLYETTNSATIIVPDKLTVSIMRLARETTEKPMRRTNSLDYPRQSQIALCLFDERKR